MWYHRPWPLGKEEMVARLKEYVADLKAEVEEVEKIIQKLESEK
jgi:predicted RNase H-like nuclease (RuvC/YqgF family)